MTEAGGLVVGVNLYPAGGDAGRRQQAAVERLRLLRGIELVNLQFVRDDRRVAAPGFTTLDVLERDSCTATRAGGVRKPLVSEIFSRLAEHAARTGARTFVFLNSDILVTQGAVDAIAASGREAVLFSRMDVDAGSGRERGINIYGTDMFAVNAAWWLRHRGLFREYIVGEGLWDNVYTAQLLCRADAALINRGGWILHEHHDALWRDSPFAAHNGFLAALDSLYFSMWVQYVEALTRARAQGMNETDELALQERIFRWPPPAAQRVKHIGRIAKARARRGLARLLRASS
jgi:hypothetical protein